MSRLSNTLFATLGLSILAACGGGSSDPVDGYVGSWRSACFAYEGIDGNTYFKRLTNNFAKASPTSLEVSFTDSIAYADRGCNNVLGAIANPASGSVQLGPKASFLGTEVDTIAVTFPSENLVGYMTANATQLFITAEAPNITLTTWGVGSPYTRVEGKQAPAAVLVKSTDGWAPNRALAGYAR